MNRGTGLAISIVIHILIVLIPVSMRAKEDKREVELFMMIEDARLRQEPEKTVPRRETPVLQKKKVPEPQEIVEPIVPETKEEIVGTVTPVPQDTAETRPERKPVSSMPTEATAGSPPPIDTEFGASIAPSFLHREMPVYPSFARKLGKEGRVLLRLTIDERGQLVQVEVVEKAGFGFVEAAIDAVKKSTFLPAKKDGKPVASRALLPVRFLLRRDS